MCIKGVLLVIFDERLVTGKNVYQRCVTGEHVYLRFVTDKTVSKVNYW